MSAQLLTPKQAAEQLGYSIHTIRQYLRAGKLSYTKFGTAIQIPQSEIVRYRREKRPVGRPSKKFENSYC